MNAIDSLGINTGASRGTEIVPSTTAHTKGNWVQISSALGLDTGALLIRGLAGGNRFLVDIGVGASGSEQIVVPDLPYVAIGSPTLSHASWLLPVRIPKGSRLAMRAQCSGAFQSGPFVVVNPVAWAPRVMPFASHATAYGVVAGSTEGTTVDAGATANTEGAAVSVTLTRRTIGLMVSVCKAAALGAAGHNLIVGVYLSGASVPLFKIPVRGPSGGLTFQDSPTPVIPCDLPPNTTLDLKAQCDTTDAEGRAPKLIIHAFHG